MHQFSNGDFKTKNHKLLGIIDFSLSTNLSDTWASTLRIHVGEEIGRPVLFAATGRESLPKILQL